MSELADQLSGEAVTGGVAPASIPSEPPGSEAASEGGERNPPSAPSEKPLTLREQLNKSIETVRTEEAKRARDIATGQFTKTEPKPEIPKTEQPAEAKAEASPAPAPPSAWTKIWDSLPPEARAIAVKREAEVAKGFDEYRGKTAQLQEISQVLEPLRPVLQQNGIQNDVQAIKRLIEWEGAFRNPQTRDQAFRNLAQQYGIELNSSVQPSQQYQPAEVPDTLRPVFDQFGNAVQAVHQDVNALKQQLEMERVSTQIAAFAKDKPHFDKVRELMGRLISGGAAPDLDSAYQSALKLHPEVSAQIEAEKQAKAQAELAKANAEKAARARAAAVSPSQRSPNGAPAETNLRAKSRSVKESILASVAELREGQRT